MSSTIPVTRQFLEQVEAERKARGWTMTRLSKEAFGNPVTYNFQVNGERGITAKSMNRIAKALGMKLVIILEGVPSERS